MKDDNFIISGFARDAHSETPLIVDFSKAKHLNRSGSTCDAYECVIQRRRVFVKRLKPEYRANPLYRAAFDKEYDLGVSLSHPSLPRYVGYGSDYIVMDFIEGDTLADLIIRGDRRLKDKRFVNKHLSELIDVVEYLHNCNIVHCDIKADNIIISPYNDRPATLIDLDKAYTAWLGNTPGDPSKYDCDGCDNGVIDFRGLGRIAEKLGMRHVAEVCDGDDVSATRLRKSLKGTPKVKKLLTGLVASIIIVGIVVVSILLHNDSKKEKTQIIADSSALPETISVAPQESTNEADIPLTTTQSSTHPVIPQQNTSQKPTEIDYAWLTALIREKAAEVEGYRRQMMIMLNCDTLSLAEKSSKTYDYLYPSGRATSTILHDAIVHYSNLSEIDVQKVVRAHPEWIKLEKDILDMTEFAINWPRNQKAAK